MIPPLRGPLTRGGQRWHRRGIFGHSPTNRRGVSLRTVKRVKVTPEPIGPAQTSVPLIDPSERATQRKATAEIRHAPRLRCLAVCRHVFVHANVAKLLVRTFTLSRFSSQPPSCGEAGPRGADRVWKLDRLEHVGGTSLEFSPLLEEEVPMILNRFHRCLDEFGGASHILSRFSLRFTLWRSEWARSSCSH